ncbi:ABC transporter permease subunit [Streptomyces sp. 3MP-14]|uniref:ABC transporter permease subunit n=1 Tax=Streptomyces mimosae TaxID=2586635 RepID=A0A5N6AQ82_9ACTN|nr:ABC transporter permease subunit [Streptomyces mimosae]KAB8178607.1 ABC transporter permease subunit [Streptomyces sp. 3MP-14]
MSTETDLRPTPAKDAPPAPPARGRRPFRLPRANYPAGIGAFVWLVIVIVPLYILVASTLQSRQEYLDNGPLSLPDSISFDSYRQVLEGDFPRYLLNTLIVTASCSALVLTLAVTVSYSIVRTRSRLSQRAFQLFLLGLAIPSQAVIIPIYLIITELSLYDTLLAIILPTAAFSLPVSVLILVGTMRDISEELYESMALDGARSVRVLFQLVIPMSRAGISTAGVFSALSAWNGFLFPLILTQSRETRVLTLGLYDFVGEFRVDIPALLAAVVLSIVPIFTAYLFARRQLINGLMGVGGK